MSDLPEFTIRVDHNAYLPAGGREANAIVTVRSRGGDAGTTTGTTTGGAAEAAEIIIIDASGSMSYSGKMAAAKRAAKAALNVLRDGVRFAVIAGANRPHMVYPQGRRLAEVNAQTRRAAAGAVSRLQAAGGTAMGSWLRLADELFAGYEPSGGGRAPRHAILLTDGKNQHETDLEFDLALLECAGNFVCDARGVGTDWSVEELRRISSCLLGSFLDVPDPKDLEAHFREMTAAAMDKRIADVLLRVWTPQHARTRFFKQMVPVVADLTGRRSGAGLVGDYPIGAWGTEEREYHLCVEVRPGDVGRRMRAAWVKVIAPATLGDPVERELASADVLLEWTDDAARCTGINARVAHHTGQSELADAIREGLAAERAGDEETATARLGRAVVLAREVGNEQIAGLLDRVVDVVDRESGTVRLKPDAAKADRVSLEGRSVRTVPTALRPEPDGDPGTRGTRPTPRGEG